jgi:polyphosphate kinase
MIDKLYEASNAGVKIQLEVRGICSWFRSERNERQHRSDSIVDNYLEHSRIYIFGNAGQTEVYFFGWFYDA